MKSEELKKNVRLLLQIRKCSCRSLAASAGMNERNVSNQVNGDTELSMKLLLAILDIFPDVSAEWLLRGTGSMVAQHGDTINIDASGDHITAKDNSMAIGGTNNTIHNGTAELAIKDAIIAAKDSVIAGKDELIASQKETISLLKEKIELMRK